MRDNLFSETCSAVEAKEAAERVVQMIGRHRRVRQGAKVILLSGVLGGALAYGCVVIYAAMKEWMQ